MAKYCPACLQEYRDVASSCADCEVPLVGSRSEAEELRQQASDALSAATTHVHIPDDSEEEIPEASLFVDTLDTGELIHQALIRSQCPAYLDEVDGAEPAPFRVAVPADLGSRAAQILSGLRRKVRAVRSSTGALVYMLRLPDDPSALELHPVLSMPVAEVVARGPRGLPELVALLGEGEEDVIEAATERILAFGEPGVEALLDGLAAHAAEIPDVTTIQCFAAMAQRLGTPLPASWRRRVAVATNPLILRDLLRCAGVVQDESAANVLVDHLTHDDEAVRYEAIDALWTLTGESHGYEPDAPADRRAQVAGVWRAKLGQVVHDD